jgi:hypothetical protein
MSIRSNAAFARLCPRFFIVILLLLGASACNEQAEVNVRPKPLLARMTFTLGGTSFAIFLPEASQIGSVGHDATSPDYKIYIDPMISTRLVRKLILAIAPNERSASYDHKVLLENGGRLEYSVLDNIGGGSGGPEAEITGRMEIGLLALSVTCHDQNELTACFNSTQSPRRRGSWGASALTSR